MTWQLDFNAARHAILDLIGGQEPQLRRELLEAIVQHPGESITMRHLRPNVAEVSVRDLSGTWHVVGTIDIGAFERQASPDWN